MRWTAVTLVVGVLALLTFGGSPTLAEDGEPATTVDQERAADRRAYETHVAALRQEHAGAWVVIAGGKVVTTGARVEDVQDAAPEALHRFVFRVGDEGDGEVFVSAWYGPRFAGPGLARAFGFDYALGRGWTRGDEVLPIRGARPFPRTPLVVGAPGRSGEALDVFIGTVGPPLVLTPGDFDRLGLARYEVPGTITVGGIPCRRATIHVEVPGIEGSATLTVVVPTVSHDRLVDLGRGRDFDFFQGIEMGFGIWAMMPEARIEGWVLFGVDRVLGQGETAVEALAKGEGKAPEAYHRFLCRMPRGGKVEYDAAAFTEEETRILNGERVEVRRSKRYGDDILLGSRADADRLGLHLAEDARCFFVMQDGKRLHARCGAAWAGNRRLGESPPTDAETLQLVWVVYPLPEGETVWFCEPLPPMPALPEPK